MDYRIKIAESRKLSIQMEIRGRPFGEYPNYGVFVVAKGVGDTHADVCLDGADRIDITSSL